MTAKPKELVVISGKGGTGKTSLVASFAALAAKAVLADCDVDAADLHLVMAPKTVHSADFSGGKRARIDQERCTGCGKCAELCRFQAVLRESASECVMPGGPSNSACRDCSYCKRSCSIRVNHEIVTMSQSMAATAARRFVIDPIACEGCGVCAWFCPADAIEFEMAVNGQWYISETRHGPMVHAKLGVAEENSGKLVSTVRQEAGKLAEQRGLDLVLIDGSPGIGCPVVASITGADLVLIVTEPTVSGRHDLERVAAVAKHFGIPALCCINKWDINPAAAGEIEEVARRDGLVPAGRVRYDRAVTEAQIHRQSVVEYQPGGVADDIRAVWRAVQAALSGAAASVAAANQPWKKKAL